MRSLKAAVIGAGSTYTPELIEGFIDRQNSLNFQTFAWLINFSNPSGIVAEALLKPYQGQDNRPVQ